MARPIWKGHISFGLVTIPVTLYSAENRNELSFHMLDKRNKSRIKYERVNEESGQPVPWDDVVKAYELEDGNYVVMDEEDFKKAAVEATQTVDIDSFTDREAIDIVYFDKPYYLVPDRHGEKGYALLREALRRSGKVAVAHVVIRTRQYLAAVLAEGNVLVLDLLRYEHELRSAEDLNVPSEDLEALKVSKREVDMALQLVDSMTAEWKPAQYKDEYRDALLKFIEKKAAAGGAPVPAQGERPHKAAQVVDMMELLKKSLQGRGGAGQEEEAATGTEGRASRAHARKAATHTAGANGKANGKKTSSSGKRAAGRLSAGGSSRRPTTAERSSTTRKQSARRKTGTEG